MNKLGQGMFFGAESACFLQSASYLLAESKVLGEGKTGKTKLSAIAELGKGGRKHCKTCIPKQKGRRVAWFITGRKVH